MLTRSASPMVRSAFVLVFAWSLLLSCCVGSSILPSTPASDTSVLVSSYLISTPGGAVTAQAWTLDLATGTPTLLAGSTNAENTFQAPADLTQLRTDTSMYVPAKELLLMTHAFQPQASKPVAVEQKKAKLVLSDDGTQDKLERVAPAPGVSSAAAAVPDASPIPFSNFYSYSFYQNTSTVIYPVPQSTLACTVYDTELDIVFGLSTIQQADGTWNASLVYMEYDGDYYDYNNVFWTMSLGATAVNNSENPAFPACAYDVDTSILSFHWPAESQPVLINLNISYLDFTPSAQFVNQVAWPPSNSAPVVYALTPSGKAGQLLFAAELTDGQAYVGTLDPLSGAIPTMFPIQSLASPRALSSNLIGSQLLVLLEYQSPWRFIAFDFAQQQLMFQGQADFGADTTIVLGVHDFNI